MYLVLGVHELVAKIKLNVTATPPPYRPIDVASDSLSAVDWVPGQDRALKVNYAAFDLHSFTPCFSICDSNLTTYDVISAYER